MKIIGIEGMSRDQLQFEIQRGGGAALGVQVHITELDVSLPVDSAGFARDEDLRRQAEIYRAVVHACLSHPGCTAIQTWGFTDKYSWIGSHSHGERGARFDLRPQLPFRACL